MTKKQRMQQIANCSEKTVQNWRESKPLLIEAMELYLSSKNDSLFEFIKEDDHIWFLLDKSKLSPFQQNRVSDILKMNTRQENDFKAGRRFEVEISKSEVKKLLELCGD